MVMACHLSQESCTLEHIVLEIVPTERKPLDFTLHHKSKPLASASLSPVIERSRNVRQAARCWAAVARRTRTASRLLREEGHTVRVCSQRLLQGVPTAQAQEQG
jgi:hypothetical protein